MKESIFDIVKDTDRCAEMFREHHWPDGVICPRCGTRKARIRKVRKDGLRYYQCDVCLKGFADTTGTVMERSHVPINVWFEIAFLMRRNLPDTQIASDVGVEENTASRIAKLIRASAFFKDALPGTPVSSGSRRSIRECRSQGQRSSTRPAYLQAR